MNFIDPSTDHLIIAVALGIVLGYALLWAIQLIIGLVIAIPLLVLGYCANVIGSCAAAIERVYLNMKAMDQTQKWIVLVGFLIVIGAVAFKTGYY